MVSTFAFLRTSFPISGIAHGTKIFLCIGTPFRSGFGKILSDSPPKYQPIRLPDLILRLRSGQAPGVCSGLILSGTFYPDLKIGVWRRRTYQFEFGHSCNPSLKRDRGDFSRPLGREAK